MAIATPQEMFAQATIAFVQVNSATPQATTTSVAVKFTAAQTAGNLNVVIVGWNDATAQVQSVVDSSGNGYQRAVGPTVTAGAATQSIYYASNIAAASANANTVTVTFSPGAAYPDVRIAEYRGIVTANPVDVVVAAQGSNTTSNSGNVATTNANDLLIGANMVQTQTKSAGSSYTSRVITTPDGDILEDRVVTSTGTYNASASVSPSGWWVMQMVAFRAAPTTPDTQPPTAPGTPVLTVVSSTQINLTWPAATDNVGVTGYLIERCGGGGCTTFTQIGTSATTSYNNTGLTASTTYTYRVRATDAAGNIGSYSSTTTATTQAPPDTQPPTAPGTPVPTVVSSSQINLTWPAATDNVAVTNYRIERCSGAGCTTFTQIGTSATTSYNSTGLTASTTYTYRVRATDAAGNLSAYSSTAAATTQAPPDTQPPTAPGTLVPTVVSSSQINLTWPVSTDNVAVTGYRVERCAGAGCSTFAQVGTPTAASFNDTGLSGSTTYRYRVRATDAAGNLGPYSAIATATTPASPDTQPPTAPGTPVPTIVSSSQINLTWPAATDNVAVTNYLIERCSGAGCTTFTQIGTSATTSYNSTGLTASTTYTYRVRATDAAGNLSAYSSTAAATTQAPPDTQPPTAPGTLVPTVVSSSQINLTWPVSTDNVAVTGYRVERCAGAGCSTFAQVGTPTAASFNDTGLSGSTTYTYRVRATDAAGNLGPYSAIATATTPASPDTQPPTAPGTPLPTVISSSQINLTWPAATDNVAVTNYLIERCSGAGCTTFTQIGTSATASYNSTGLTASTTYTYQVRATDAAGNLSAYSPTASATTQAPPDTQPPTAPDTPVLTVVSTTEIDLTWPPATDDVAVTTYLIERCAGAGCTTFTQIGTSATTSYNDTSLAPSTSYTYRVRAADAANNIGPYSATATATTQNGADTQPPTAPGTPVLTVVSSTRIDMVWPAATDNVAVTNYLIESCSGAGCTTFTQIGTSATTSYNSTGLTASTTYTYQVRATDAAGNLSAYSPAASATTQAPPDTQPPTAPGNLTATPASGTQVVLNWATSTDNVGVTGYRIEQCQGAGCTNFVEIASIDSAPTGGPLSVSANANYFKDASGVPLILGGSQTWNSLQDWGSSGSLSPLDFNAFVNFLVSHGHNFTLLWRTELTKFCGLPTTDTSPPDFTVGPHPWLRTGPGLASDGGLKFDLTKFDQTYFDRLRGRTQALNTAGIYAGVYLFSGEWPSAYRCLGDGYALSGANNINGIDDGGGIGSMTMTAPNAITAIQDAYVEKTVDTLNDLPNVLWIVSEEAPANSTWWNDHLIAHIRSYESGKPAKHPIGYGVLNDLRDAVIINSNTDWIAPAENVFLPNTNCGSGTPPCKVVINDSDHSYFGMWNDSAQTNRSWAWQNFTNGFQVAFMDPYVVSYPRQGRNLCVSPVNGICSGPDTRWDTFRDNLGYILRYSRKLNLANVSSRGVACSSIGHCLAQTPSVGAEYLIYAPNGGTFTVDLSAMSSSRTLNVEWFNPATGATTISSPVAAGSSARSFTAPFSGDAVLYLVDSAGHAGSAAAVASSYTVTGLTPSTGYTFRVRAIDAANNLGPYSPVASATTQAGADLQPPTTPGTPVATVVSSNQINLSWPAATDNVGVTGYFVERCAGTGCSNFAQVGSPATTSFNDTTLAASTNYTYRVRASDAAGNLSAYSTTASATTQAPSDTQPPTAPGTPVLTVVSTSQINLTWPPATDNVAVTGYGVERCAGAGCTTFTQVATTTTSSFNDIGLAASTIYTYRVRATDAASNLGLYSATATATTSAPAPITLVQHTSKDGGTTTSSTLAFATNTTVGNWIGVAIRAGKTGQTLTVSDNRGDTYRKAIQLNETVDVTTLAIYYAENIAGGATTVTVSDNLNGGTLRFAIFEYAGVAPSNSLDGAASGQGTTASPASGAAATTVAGDLVLGALSSANARTFTAGSGWTIQERVPASSTRLAVESQIKSAVGSVTASGTLSSSDSWGAVAAAFRAAAAGPPPPADLTIAKTHSGSFSTGQIGATYTLKVTNSGAGPTTAAVTVTDALPAGLTATAMTGASWTCTQPAGPCTRSDVLAGGASFAPITLTVNVANNAPASLTNVASVSGGGDANMANNTASDNTAIVPPDTQPPSAPGQLTAVAPNGTHVNLSWGPATDDVGVTDYRVERCDGVCVDVGFVKIAAPTGTTFSDSGLTPNTTYSYIVRAEDGASNLGPYSNVATVTTGATIPELIAAYAFDEGSGSTVTDQSGNGRTGAIANATWATTGKYGKALLFNGANAKVSIPDAAALHLTTGMTLEAWVNPSAASSAWRDLIYKGNDNYYLMATTSQGGVPAGGGTFAATNVNLLGTSVLPLNTWTHLATTYDGATLRLYVNGAAVSSVARTGALTSSTNPLEIGGDSIFGQFFSGMIDEVRVYNIALAPSQIQADMVRPLGAAMPVVVFSRSNIDFGSVTTGSTSAVQNITLTNGGTASLMINGVSMTGPNASDFGQTNNCGAQLAPSGTCNVAVTFSPLATGTRIAALSVADNASGSPHTVSLTGTATGFSIVPRVSVLTPSLSQQFSVTGGGTGTPVWAVDGVEGGGPASGTISSTGLYTPPTGQGTHTVSYTDSTHSSSATAYVTAYPGTFTHHNDNFRTGQNLGEIVLTPSSVTSATFGKLFSFDLDGLSMASPLYVAGVDIPGKGVHNVVYVATQHDSVYAFDADGLSTTPLWQKSFLSSGVTTVPALDTGECCDIAPEIGITGTPVIDPATGTLYVVAKTKEGTAYQQRLHALDIATAAEKFGGPILIQASVPGSGQGASGGMVPFDALHENQRPALLLSNGIVYIAFGSHGDVQPYHGWVLGYNATTLQQTMAVNLSPDAEGGGIWQANGGPAADTAGNIYVVTGNGTFDTNNSNRKNYGDSIVKISPAGAILDFFTPHDEGAINANNFDLGAAGAMLLPDQSGAHTHMMVTGGKNNTVYLVDRDNMGGYNASNDSQIVQSLVDIFPFGSPEPGNYSAPVYFNGTIYFGPIRDSVQAFRLTGSGLLSTSPTSVTTDIFNYPGATLAISANGSSNGILWAIQRNGDCGTELTCGSAAPGVLKAYDASNLAVQLYSSDQMPARDAFDFATKFSVPLVANGKVFLSSMSKLTVYGLLP